MRRLTLLFTALAVAIGGILFAMTGPFQGGAGTTQWYQCVNNAGHIESRLGGTVKPTCAHATDHILTWHVLDSLLPPDPTTTPPTIPPTVPPTVPPTTPPTVHAPPPPSWWTPGNAHSIQWWPQFTGVLAIQPGIQLYDTDWSTTTPTQVAAEHVAGAKAICQIDAGQWEPGRPDANQFPAGAIGNSTFPLGPLGSKWLDIRNQTIRNIITARIETCAQKGFDGIDVLGVDGYANVSGFALTAADQVIFNTYVADTAHANGLAAGLNEDRAQINVLQPSFDFGVATEAQFLGQAGDFAAFTNAGKPVFDAEFTGGLTFCPQDAFMHISGMHANVFFNGAGYNSCPVW